MVSNLIIYADTNAYSYGSLIVRGFEYYTTALLLQPDTIKSHSKTPQKPLKKHSKTPQKPLKTLQKPLQPDTIIAFLTIL